MATEGEIVEFTMICASRASAWNKITRKASTITLRTKFRKLRRGVDRRYDEKGTRQALYVYRNTEARSRNH
jgi:hypothetical protein